MLGDTKYRKRLSGRVNEQLRKFPNCPDCGSAPLCIEQCAGVTQLIYWTCGSGPGIPNQMGATRSVKCEGLEAVAQAAALAKLPSPPKEVPAVPKQLVKMTRRETNDE